MKRKNWLITGVSSGLGKALAQAVIDSGDFVIGTFRMAEQADSFNATYQSKAFAIVMDVTKLEDIKRTVAYIISNIGRLDVLVNNAGFGFAGAIEETTLSETRAVFEANYFGPLLLTQSVLPLMRSQNSGTIIQISSHGGIKSFPGFGIYNAAKFALEGFSEALSLELGPLGINVVIIEPGPFRTNFAGGSLREASNVMEEYGSTAGIFRERLKEINGKQEGDPTKAAQAIVKIVHTGHSTLRVPLGKIALATISSKITSLQQDLEANREVAASVTF